MVLDPLAPRDLTPEPAWLQAALGLSELRPPTATLGAGQGGGGRGGTEAGGADPSLGGMRVQHLVRAWGFLCMCTW